MTYPRQLKAHGGALGFRAAARASVAAMTRASLDLPPRRLRAGPAPTGTSYTAATGR